MVSPVARSPRRRQLGALLRQARKGAGLSGEALASGLGVSQSHLSRVELGDTAASVELVDRWIVACHGDEEVRSQAAALVESVTTEFVEWKTAESRGLAAIQQQIADAEGAANSQLAWVPMIIPGLLQTPSYTHHLITGELPDRTGVAEAVSARMQRQPILFDRSKTLRWVIGEPGLRWRVGPKDVMIAQLDRLAMLATEPHLDIRVLSFAVTRSVWHDHGFTLWADRSDGEPDLVTVELLTGEASITEPHEVAQYKAAYERLAELSLEGAEAAAFIRKVMTELRA